VVDVALVHPPVDTQPLSSAEGQTSEYPLMPMGLFSTADYLERSGFSVRVVNLALERLLNPGAGLRQLLAGLEAEVVGVSLHWFVHSYGAVEVARFVKSLLPDSKVVLGASRPPSSLGRSWSGTASLMRWWWARGRRRCSKSPRAPRSRR
jgi:hypothetical protein